MKRKLKTNILRITPMIQKHLDLLKKYYKVNYIEGSIQDVDSTKINDQIILLRQKGLSRKEICQELNITIKSLEKRITNMNKEQAMAQAQLEIKEIVDNFAKYLIEFTDDMVKFAKEENYEHANEMRNLIDELVKYTADELERYLTLDKQTIFERLDKQRIIAFKEISDDK
jgi:DNA-binding CsgD family transcriptional regulator